MRKRRRLRKMNSEALCLDEQQDQQDAENENEEVAEQAAEKAAAEAHAEAEAAEAGSEGSINSGGFCHGFSVKSRCAVVNPLVL